MTTNKQLDLGKLSLLTITVICSGLGISPFDNKSLAQVVPDETLGSESSVVTPDEINGLESDKISGGAVRGSNLFHSFQEFSVGEGRGAYFDNPAAIQNIFSRVTGNNISDIQGVLGVLGNANLFLMNPNGIIFGNNASLDIRGSFLATTADSILFPDDNKFSALNPEAAPLLTVDVEQPVGLEFAGSEGIISSQANLSTGIGQNLALIGGNLVMEKGSITVISGRIELGGLTEKGVIEINDDGSFNFPHALVRADVSLTNQRILNIFSGLAEVEGSISINARNVEIKEGSQLGTIDTTDANFLFTTITGEEVNLQSVSNRGGNIEISATEKVIISGVSANNQTSPNLTLLGDITDIINDEFTRFSGISNFSSGDIVINADSLNVIDNGIINSSRLVEGSSGNITINTANSILFNRSLLGTSTLERGSSGNITIKAGDTISFEGGSVAGTVGGEISQFPSAGESSDEIGDIEIEAQSLFLREQSIVSSGTLIRANAGNIRLKVSDSTFLDNSLISSSVGSPLTEGDAGEINIQTRNFSLTNGAEINSVTDGKGNGGKIQIKASDSVNISGVSNLAFRPDFPQFSQPSGFPSGLFTATTSRATGRGGAISVNTNNLRIVDRGVISTTTQGVGLAGDLEIITSKLQVLDGAEVTVSSLGLNSGNAGKLNITASSILLADRGKLIAETESGRGGNIILNISDKLQLQNKSLISTTAGTAESGGNGGNVTIDAPFIIAFPNEDSDIRANAFEGNGGRVNITSQGIFGIESRDGETILSDITASSEFGQDGEVEINTSAVDPTRSLNSLPQEATETEVAQSCQEAESKRTLEFFDIGRGGLPPTPEDLFSSDAIIAEWIPLEPKTEVKIQSNFDEVTTVTLFNSFPCQKY